jgi:ABC-type nickel/cobalt efflux system permease component RcnA
MPAFAHPLGNFTINRFSELVLNGDRVDVLYIVDYAEIPAFQERQRMSDDRKYLAKHVGELAHGLTLEVGSRRLVLALRDTATSLIPGQGGLKTMRLQIELSATLPGPGQQHASYRDGNYAGRLGWKEIIVTHADGARLLQSSVPGTSVTDALRHYPQNMLTSPLDVTEARFSFIPGPSTATAQSPFAPGPGGSFITDRFAALIAPNQVSLPVLLLSLVMAIGLGALHALSPGHGKAVMAAYLVGARGTARHALGLGLTITATHTAGVFALGMITLYAASIVTPERLYPWLTLVSGLTVLALGAALIWSRTRSALVRAQDAHSHHHDGGDGHGHGHGRIHRAGIIGLGISSGMLPCPSALVVLLAAISLHRIVFGLLLIVAFSSGLALVLTAIGLAFSNGMPLIRRLRRMAGGSAISRSLTLVPIASALMVTLAGLGLTAHAIPGVR